MQQQSGKKEAEYQQIITNLNRTTTDNITKLKEEKVIWIILEIVRRRREK